MGALGSRLAVTALRGADIFGAGTKAGARLAMTGRFLEQFGIDIMRCAEQHLRVTVGKDARADQASTG